jgi:hypothetical protein
MNKITELEYGSSQEAWEGINEYLVFNAEHIPQSKGVKYGSLIILYNVFISIRKAWVNPEFDFGRIFSYRIQKWNKLLTNYVDLNQLDLVKSEIEMREKKGMGNYNVSFLFDNNHLSGHGCLLHLTFIRRPNRIDRVMQLSLRSSEVTKRLLLDFLLIQRIGEYVFKEGTDFSIEFFCPNIYITAENFVMYDNIKPIRKILKGIEKTPFQEKVLESLKKFKNTKVEDITYRVFRRAAKSLQLDNDGNPIGYKPLFAKNLQLYK